MLNKTVLSLLALAVLTSVLWSQGGQTPAPAKPAADAEYKIPPEAAQHANPVKSSPESVAKGKKIYALDCALCHGEKGDGKGDLSSDVKGIVDLTNEDAMKNRTDGELFYIIKKGKGSMPPEGDRLKSEEGWNLVNYVRSLAKK